MVSYLVIKINQFTDIIISGNKNETKKENKNILKYKDRAIYVQLNLNVKTKAIAVTIGKTGTILLSFMKKLGSLFTKTFRRIVT